MPKCLEIAKSINLAFVAKNSAALNIAWNGISALTYMSKIGALTRGFRGSLIGLWLISKYK